VLPCLIITDCLNEFVIGRWALCELIPRSACKSRALARWGRAARRGNARDASTERKGLELILQGVERRASRCVCVYVCVIAVLLALNGAHRSVTRSLAGGTGKRRRCACTQFTEGYRVEEPRGTERKNGR